MLLFIFLLLLIIIGKFILIEYLANNKLINNRQYRIYIIICFVLLFILCGFLENYCNIKNGF